MAPGFSQRLGELLGGLFIGDRKGLINTVHQSRLAIFFWHNFLWAPFGIGALLTATLSIQTYRDALAPCRIILQLPPKSFEIKGF